MKRAAIGAVVIVAMIVSLPARADAAEPAVLLTIDGVETNVHFFDDRARDTYSEFITIALTNTAEVPVTGLTSSLAGERPDDFEVLADGCHGERLMLAGDACEILLRYHPVAEGFSDAELTLAYTGGERAVVLAGVARAPKPEFSMDKTAVTFAPLGLGYGWGGFVEIRNFGYGNLNVGAITMTGDAEHFYVDAADRCRDQIVREGDRCSVGISFVPLAEGRFSGTITIEHDAPGSPATVHVEGEGVMIHPAITGDARAEVLDGDTASQTLTIKNTYYRNMQLGTIALSGANAGAYALIDDGCSGMLLAREATCSVRFEFAPATPGDKHATLEIPTDAPGGVKRFSLEGASIERIASLRASRSSVKLGTVRVRKAKRARVWLTSDGTVPVEITRVRRKGSSWFSIVRDRCSGKTLMPGERCELIVQFKAKASGLRTAVLRIGTSDDTRALRMAGRGLARR